MEKEKFKKTSMLTSQLFRLQPCAQIIYYLEDKGFIEIDLEQAQEATYSLARLLKDSIELPDFSYQFIVTDKQDKKKFIA